MFIVRTTLPTGRGLGYIGAAATAWGTGAVAASVLYGSSGLGPVAVSFWRFCVGTAVLFAMTRRLPAPVVPRPRAPRRLVFTGVGLASYQAAYFAAAQRTGVALATVVTLGAGPVLIAIGGRLTGRERTGVAGWVGVGCALFGLVLLLGDPGGPRSAVGIGLALLSAAGYAAVTLYTRTAATPATDPLVTAVGSFAVGTVALFPFALYEGILPTAGDLTTSLALIGYLGLVPTALAYALFFAGLTAVRATTAAVVALVEPVTATVAAILLLDERLTARAVAGSAVLLATVLVIALAERRTPA